MKRFATVAMAAGLALATVAGPAAAQQGGEGDRMTIETQYGDIVVALKPDLAPNSVARLKKLASADAYDNVVFHRVIEGFMAQTGDVQFGKKDSAGYQPERAGMGGSDMPDLDAEFSDAEFDRGTVGMARAQDPNSANSQFFIMLADGDFLNGKYTVVGDVVSGMDAVDQIKKGDPDQNGAVENPDVMETVTAGGEAADAG